MLAGIPRVKKPKNKKFEAFSMVRVLKVKEEETLGKKKKKLSLKWKVILKRLFKIERLTLQGYVDLQGTADFGPTICSP